MQTPLELKNKKVLVMGLGLHGGGIGTVEYLKKAGAKVTVTDLRTRAELGSSLRKLSKYKNIRYVLGGHEEKDFLNSDLVIKNPGVKHSSPYLRLAKEHKIPVTTDMGIFFVQSPAEIIGITGTRGKSTAAYLTWKFLSVKKRRIFLGGNIRKSVLEFLPKLKKGDVVVLELSSFQLSDLAPMKISPHIAVLTNIMRDHLNWHTSWQDYINAKANIFLHQKPGDYFFANGEDSRVKKILSKALGKIVFTKLSKTFAQIVDKNLGSHYRSSVALAIGVAKHYGVPDKSMEKILQNFHGLESRQQKIAVIKGITFINDTTATIPDAAIAAIRRFGKAVKKGNKLILIGGGQDKKLIFGPFVREIKKYVGVFVMLPGTATDQITRIMNHESGIGNKKLPIYKIKNMKEAVTAAYKTANSGDIVLLSPGAASFGLFLNEFDRGEKFVREVFALRTWELHWH